MSLLSYIRWPIVGKSGSQGVTTTSLQHLTESMRRVQQGRYATLVAKQYPHECDIDIEMAREQAWRQLEEKMSLVPSGETELQWNPGQDPSAGGSPIRATQTVSVAANYIDRFAVSNVDYLQFVAAGGYQQMEFWPREIWSKVIHWVDDTGQPGPRFWINGKPDPKKLRHPVVGICWYEANDFAKWAGKQLPSSSQWQHAGTWAGDVESNSRITKYPWGNGFCSTRANTCSAGFESTVEVDQYHSGGTSNGIYQLIGNVWEWTANSYLFADEDLELIGHVALAEIRGGAFDTYFESQANCLFRSGQSLLRRNANIGFRCCLPVDNIQTTTQP